MPSKDQNSNLRLKKLISDNASEVFSVKYSPDGKSLAAACGDGKLKIYSSANYKLSNAINTAEKGAVRAPLTCVKFRPISNDSDTAKRVLVSSSQGKVQQWHTAGRCLLNIDEEGNHVNALEYNTDASQFVTAGKDAKLRQYDDKTGKLVSILEGGYGKQTAGHWNRIFALKWHPTDPTTVFSGGWDNTVQIWDTRIGHAVRRIYGPHICGEALDFNDNTLLTGSWRPSEQLQLWDVTMGSLIETIPWPTTDEFNPCSLYSARFNSAGTIIGAGGSGSNEAKLIERHSGRVLGSITSGGRAVYSLSFSRDDSNVAVGTGDGSIYILGFDN
eukprot:gb/GECH01012747.1/.p1 GENE.gb/GECH01012747.1/~~gb/GECH01012747.1/.p1  ORF type:complete len:330 (+),score=64.28 gb/GECH01012747.1/:1-990(+)